MSTTVDQRVVEMRFDNQHFERNVSTTMSTLDKLKQSLNFTGATKGLEDVSGAAKKIDMNGLGTAVESVNSKFSALGVMGVTALANITNSAVNAGKKIVSALTIDPIKSGFQEYETQIGAVQTILANTQSKGTTLQDVNAALDELNTYADKTIYNFTEMTRNIGTFTAAGVDLDKSVTSIKGIANLAAVSGSTSQQASTAMYQLSQALASGTVKLMDWNSVVNAGMGGQVFQDALKRTATQMGYNVDAMIEKYGSFRESLSKGEWLTADVLTETLTQLSGAYTEADLIAQGYSEKQAKDIMELAKTAEDAATKVKTFTQLWDTLKESAQSGWTQTWEILVGDFGEAKEFLTKVSDTIGGMISESANARNELLAGGLSSGWKQLLGAGIADEAGYQDMFKEVAKSHNVAFDEMIEKSGSFEAALKSGLTEGKISSDMLTESVIKMADKMSGMTEEERKAAGYTADHVKQIEELAAGLKDGSISMEEFAEKIKRPSGRENLIDALWNSFNAVMSVITPIKEAFRDIFPPTTSEQLYRLTEILKEFTSKLTLSENASDNLKRTFKGLFAVLDIAKEALFAVFKAISPLFGGMDNLGGGILEVTASIGDWLVGLRDSIKEGNLFGKAVEKIHAAFDKIGNFISPISESVKEFASNIKVAFTDISDVATVRLQPLAKLGNAIKIIFVELGKALSKVFPVFSSVAKSIGHAFGTITQGISSAIQEANFDKLFDIFNGGVFAAIGVGIARFVKSIADITSNGGGFLENINDILEGVGDSFEAFTQQLKAKTLFTIAGAIALLAASLIALSLVDSEKLTTSLGAITVLIAELMGVMSIFSKISGGMGAKSMIGMLVIGKTITSLAAALTILAVAMKIISTMKWDELLRGLTGTVVGLGAMVGAVNLLPEKKVTSAAKAITKMSVALLIFSGAMKVMGSMSWAEIARGLTGTVVGLGAMVAAVNMLPKGLKVQAMAIMVLAGAIVVLAGALWAMGSMSWESIAKSLVTLAVALTAITVATKFMPKSLPIIAAGLLIVAAALTVLGGALHIMGSMSWDGVAKSLITLGGALAIIAIGVNAMRGALFGAAALLIVSAAILVLTPALQALGSMSLDAIGRSLLALAGAFAVIGIAGLLLQPLVPTLVALSVAMTLFGVGCAAVGAGVLLFATGMTALAAAGAAGATAIVMIASSIIGLIPYLIEQIGVGIIKLCEVISGSADAICSAATVIIQAVVQAIVESVPTIVDGVLVLIDSLLTSLIEYGPVIVGKLFDFLIVILDMLAAKLPDLIQSGVNLVMALFSGIVDALKSIDPSVIVNGILAIGAMSALMIAMAAMAALTPAAMVGVLGMGAVIAELAIVLAAIGALAQIPGLQWLIEEGGYFMQTIGTAIGQFVGGIVGGIAQGVTASLPQIGTDLSNFMANIQPFIDGAKAIDASVMDGVKTLVGVVLALTGANIVERLSSWLTGGSSLADFGAEIAKFAPYIKQYADCVTGINVSAITASATAAKALSELATNLPNSGGLAGVFAGENDIGSFGMQLVPFGIGLRAYSQAVTGVDIQAIVDSVAAAKALVDMSSNVPNEGGMIAWFTGDNSIAKFGGNLIALGIGLRGYSEAISGINVEAITASAGAAKVLADMTACIPNEGGMLAWFTGENSVARFSYDLILLGDGIRGFSEAVAGVIPENIVAAAGAAKSLADMVSCIPNEGGIVAWFTGENSIATFASQLPILGYGLREFSTSIAGIIPENITAAATAAKSIAEMANTIPNEGGIVAWFTGENSIARFASQLPLLGTGLQGFSTSVAGIVPENIAAAATAAKSLAEMANTIPNEGGVISWFAGENSMSSFAGQLPLLGAGLKGFSDSVAGIIPENVTSAASAAKSLAQLTTIIPNEGGMKAWFGGESGLAKFSGNLPALGAGLKGFSDSVAGISPENVTAAASAAKSLGDMTATIPKNTDRVCDFGDNLVDFGSSLSTFFADTSGITGTSVSGINAVIASIKSVISLDSSKLKSLSEAIDSVTDSLKDMSKVDSGTVIKFKNALEELGKKGAEALLKPFEDIVEDMTKAGKKAIEAFINGAEDKVSSAEKACKTMVTTCADAIENKRSSFYDAGEYLVKGFASGISENTYRAKAKAKAMAKAAAKAAEDELDINSPSKVFRAIGTAVPEGFAQGIDKLGHVVKSSAVSMADTAIGGVSNAITRIAEAVETDIDTQPTIRPVLDLSNIKSGAGTIGGLFGNSSVGVLANVGAISTMMNRRSQNGGNEDVVNAIGKLRDDFVNADRATYNINGVTYDDGSNIRDAVETIVRYANIGRRV